MASSSIIFDSSNSSVKQITGSQSRRVGKKPVLFNLSHHPFKPNKAEHRLDGTTVPSVDLIFENHFSLFLIRPVSPAGQTWLDENVGDESTLTFGGAVVCEPRYVEAIAHGAVEAGMEVR